MKDLGPGDKTPEIFNVIIEIPTQGEPVKYEVDKISGTMRVDRFLNTAMYYPCNYGYVPKTLSEDGDPVDVLVMTPWPLITGSVISCRALGVLNMSDEKGKDAKILAVPISKLTKMYDDLTSYEDAPTYIIDMIGHFFEHYKDLEKGKWVKIEGWAGVDAAHAEIVASMERYK